MQRAVQTAVIQWLDPMFDHRHPGPCLNALIRAAGPAIRMLQPNDRWNLAAFIGDWVKILELPPYRPRPEPKRIFIFGCYRGQFTRDLVLALMLAWRGHRVTVGYLPKLRSPIKSPLADAPNVQDYLIDTLASLGTKTGGRVRCIDLSFFGGRQGAVDEVHVAAITRADTIMRLRREQLDYEDLQTRESLDYYERVGREAQSIANAYFAEHRDEFDLAVIANGASFENGHFCHAAKAHGLPVNTHEKFAFAKVIVINHGDAFFHFKDLDRIWLRRSELGFLDEPFRSFVIDRAWHLLNQRRDSTGREWGWQYQKGRRSRSVQDIELKLSAKRDEFVLVCPNVPFDAGYDGWLEIFPSMRDWLVETLRFLIERSPWKIVVRAHPAETRPSYGEEKLVNLIADAGIESDRLVIVPGDSDINTYDLMPLCRFASVFASTTGVELAMHGKPVIAGASVYYARCGISVSAPDRRGYFAALAQLCSDSLPERQGLADDAAMLYFMFHYLLQWKFPYDKPSQVAALPPRRLVEASDIEGYIETLDVLSMTTQEYETALPDLMNGEIIRHRYGFGFKG